MEPMLCPSCKTNRTRFNILEQQVKPVKLNPQTGQVEEEYTNETMNVFHMAYQDLHTASNALYAGLLKIQNNLLNLLKISLSLKIITTPYRNRFFYKGFFPFNMVI